MSRNKLASEQAAAKAIRTRWVVSRMRAPILRTLMRAPALVTHSVVSNLRARVLAFACGYQDANEPDRLCAATRRSSWPAAGCSGIGDRPGPAQPRRHRR
jgi:hypothetical protein